MAIRRELRIWRRQPERANDPAAAAALADLTNHVNEYVRALPLRSGTTPLKFAPDYEKWLIEAMSPRRQRQLLEGLGYGRGRSRI